MSTKAVAKPIKTRNEQEANYLVTIRYAVAAVRADKRPRRLMLEIHPPTNGKRTMRYRSYQDGDVIPWDEP